jgi:hypothetical protein
MMHASARRTPYSRIEVTTNVQINRWHCSRPPWSAHSRPFLRPSPRYLLQHSRIACNPQDLTVGVVDEDHSNLSRQFLQVLNQPPLFKRAVLINANEIDAVMNAGRMIFVLEIAPRFLEDLLAARKVSLQLDVDATAMAPAGNGAIYIQTIFQMA